MPYLIRWSIARAVAAEVERGSMIFRRRIATAAVAVRDHERKEHLCLVKLVVVPCVELWEVAFRGPDRERRAYSLFASIWISAEVSCSWITPFVDRDRRGAVLLVWRGDQNTDAAMGARRDALQV